MEKSIKFLGVCILLSVIIISVALVYTNVNDRYKVAGVKVFDTHTGKFVEENIEQSVEITLEYTEDEAKALIDMQNAGAYLSPRQKRIINDYNRKQLELASSSTTKYPWETEEIPQGDFSKVVIAGKSHKKDYQYSVSFTVKNNDTVAHNVHCKVIFYNKNGEPIITNGIAVGVIEPGKLGSATIKQLENYELIEKYELILEESPMPRYR